MSDVSCAETGIDAAVEALENAVRTNPGDHWRYQVLAAAYETRASNTNELKVAARDLRTASKIRTVLANRGLVWDRASQSPCQERTVPYQTEQVSVTPAVIVRPAPKPTTQPDGSGDSKARWSTWLLAAASATLIWWLPSTVGLKPLQVPSGAKPTSKTLRVQQLCADDADGHEHAGVLVPCITRR